MGPPARRDAAGMAWCAATHRAILWGGILDWGGSLAFPAQKQYGYHTDTWEWDGDLWVQVADSGPPGRSFGCLSADSAGGILLFGGVSDPGFGAVHELFGDTWRWDGHSWVQLADTGPSPRYSAHMAHDPSTGEVLLQGGHDDAGVLWDTWSWDGSEWTQRIGFGPNSDAGFMGWAAPPKRVTLCDTIPGGPHGLPGAGMWVWDHDQSRWEHVQDIIPPGGTNGCAIPTGLLAFGGELVPPQPPRYFTADTWTWDGQLWRRVQDFGPPPRITVLICWDPDRERVVLHGGIGMKSDGFGETALTDTWELSLPPA